MKLPWIYSWAITGVMAISLSILAGCESNSTATGRDVSEGYGFFKKSKLATQCSVNSKTDGNCTLKINIDVDKLSRDNEDVANVLLRYKIYTSYAAPQPIDSGKASLTFGLSDRGLITKTLQFSVDAVRGYVLEIELRDLQELVTEKTILDLIDPRKFSSQSFILSDFNGKEIFQPFVTQADSYLITTVEPQTALYSKFYSRDFPIAQPPFSAVHPKPFDFTPDKLSQLKVIDEKHAVLYVTQNGFYQITNDQESKRGGVIHFFGNYYPDAKTVNDLLLPLRYITTSEEYKGFEKSNDLKKSIDAFWLRLGGDETRARKLIQSYYSRVQKSNQLFTSYIEGWKSDRGMCYTVFGPPTSIRRSTSKETWYYGESGSYNTLKLDFVKVVNPFSSNDFRLNRNATLKSPWYRAVDYWRQGRVITYNE